MRLLRWLGRQMMNAVLWCAALVGYIIGRVVLGVTMIWLACVTGYTTGRGRNESV